MEKRHRPFAQGMDDMVVFDRLRALAHFVHPRSWQFQRTHTLRTA